MKYMYDNEAEKFIRLLPKFNKDKFEKWVDNIVLLIGSNNVLQYIDEKKRWNVKCELINIKLKCDFSQQSKNLISQLDSFDTEECIIWFSNSLSLTKGDVINYLDSIHLKKE